MFLKRTMVVTSFWTSKGPFVVVCSRQTQTAYIEYLVFITVFVVFSWKIGYPQNMCIPDVSQSLSTQGLTAAEI